MTGEVKCYHATTDETFSLLEKSKEGLSNGEASIRLTKHAYNEAETRKLHGPFYTFLKQFPIPLIYVLIASSFFFVIELEIFIYTKAQKRV